MYAVSEEYREAMHSKVQTFRLTGTAGNKPFTEANILKGSFSITNQRIREFLKQTYKNGINGL